MEEATIDENLDPSGTQMFANVEKKSPLLDNRSLNALEICNILAECSDNLLLPVKGSAQPRPSPSPPPPPPQPPVQPEPEPEPETEPPQKEPDGTNEINEPPPAAEVVTELQEINKDLLLDQDIGHRLLQDLLDSLPLGESTRSPSLVPDDGSNSSGLSSYLSAKSEAVGDTDSEYGSLVSAEEDELTLVPEDSILINLQTPSARRSLVQRAHADNSIAEQVVEEGTDVQRGEIVEVLGVKLPTEQDQDQTPTAEDLTSFQVEGEIVDGNVNVVDGDGDVTEPGFEEVNGQVVEEDKLAGLVLDEHCFDSVKQVVDERCVENLNVVVLPEEEVDVSRSGEVPPVDEDPDIKPNQEVIKEEAEEVVTVLADCSGGSGSSWSLREPAARKDDVAADESKVLDIDESLDRTTFIDCSYLKEDFLDRSVTTTTSHARVDEELADDPHESVTVEACRIALELLDLSHRSEVQEKVEDVSVVEEEQMPCVRRGEEEREMADADNNDIVAEQQPCAAASSLDVDENVNVNENLNSSSRPEVKADVLQDDVCDNTRVGAETQNGECVENGLTQVTEEALSSSPCPTLDEVCNQSEAGPDVAQIKDNEFRSAVEFFQDPSAFEFLQKAGGKAFTESALSRMSLYVKFDPLMKPPTPVPPKSTPESSNTCPEETDSSLAATNEVQKLIDFGTSPCKPKRLLDTTTVPETETAVATEHPGDLRQDLVTRELYFQEQLLKKDREWNDRVKQMDKENQQLMAQVQRMRETQQQMRQIVVEYEVTISQLISEKEKDKQSMLEMKTQLTKERDQALEDMQGVEVAFGDLHRRYEKSKAAVDALKKNEDTLKHCVAECQLKLKKQEQKYELLKSHAEEKLQSANAEVDLIKKGADSEIVAQRAQLKKAEMKIDSLEKNLEQKIKENAELTNICDELIAKVGLSK